MSVVTYHDNHICAVCRVKFSGHAGPSNPHAPANACPPGKFPKWPSTIDDEAEAGKLFDERVRKFWTASKTTFKPR